VGDFLKFLGLALSKVFLIISFFLFVLYLGHSICDVLSYMGFGVF
jgi:hypothetical protein